MLEGQSINNNLRLAQFIAALDNPTLLLKEWEKDRDDIFQDQFNKQLDPENKPLRSLSDQYQDWKNKFYPGRKKRELTGETLKSRRIKVVSRFTLRETIQGRAAILQNRLELPLLPIDWSNPTAKALMRSSIEYIKKI